MGKMWRITPHDSARIAALQQAAGIPAVMAQLLLARGILHPDDVRRFLEVKLSDLRDPEELPGVPEAAARLLAAVRDGRRIVVYGDYDADGMTGAAILLRALQALGAQPGYYVPNRLEEGYGLNHEALRQLARDGASLVISVDCGIASTAEAETAAEVGLELIITDHHEFAAELPRAAAIVHPRLPSTNYPFGGLCGAGVAFKLAWALCRLASGSEKVEPRYREYLLGALGLAAIGTVADVVPLLDENRAIVKHGLAALRQRPSAGLAALLEVTGLAKKGELGSEDIAFSIGPHLNAAGRLGQARLGVELLITESASRGKDLAEYIHQLNESRTSLERSIYLAANKQAQEAFDPAGDSALVLAGRGWHAGVVGIVAGRLSEKFNRPVVLLSLDELGVKPAGGSARAPAGLNLHAALQACTEHLLTHGGHAAAAGLSLEEARIDDFRQAFCEYMAEQWTTAALTPQLRIDAEAPLSQLTLRTVGQIEQLAPFGQGNPRPVLCASEVRLAGPPKRIGAGERHLALRVEQHGVTLRAMAFGQAEWAEPLEQQVGGIDIAYRPVINEFRGMRNVEIHLVDWRPAGELDAAVHNSAAGQAS